MKYLIFEALAAVIRPSLTLKAGFKVGILSKRTRDTSSSRVIEVFAESLVAGISTGVISFRTIKTKIS